MTSKPRSRQPRRHYRAPERTTIYSETKCGQPIDNLRSPVADPPLNPDQVQQNDCQVCLRSVMTTWNAQETTSDPGETEPRANTHHHNPRSPAHTSTATGDPQ